MLAEQFNAAITAARTTAALDDIARLLYKANVEGHIADAEAEALFGAVQGRRGSLSRPAASIALANAVAVSARRKPVRPRSPDRAASIERRRRVAASGALPPTLAAKFTTGEIAVLSIVSHQCRSGGTCSLPLDKVAAFAGVSRSLAKQAIRLAYQLGLILRIERRRRGGPSLTNVLRIIDSAWRSWIERGRIGGRKLAPTITGDSKRAEKAVRSSMATSGQQGSSRPSDRASGAQKTSAASRGPQ